MRAQLSPDVVTDPRYSVLECFSGSRSLLGDLRTVWYTTPEGAQTDWHHPGAVAHDVRQAAARREGWDTARRARLAELERLFRREGEPVQLVLPALRVRADRDLLLDGTHRAVAAYRADVPVTLLLFTLCGPLPDTVLPDLFRHR
ncbi:hypothetical protein [Actinomadura parmotrematis]|uniref:ParB N-terminal domain-containing protein n=1 Tax=Actinomadura parmotrematis TaxID=2864039 RepID=A0ABS7G599_9ACTN|nr:hypothetical protein [Actinomadura parmotrematis]MBW8486972.1 hypothetical protein [Actinomadura parmotrematis]